MNPETQFREGLDELAEHYKSVLTLLGEDADREGLQKTPMRVAKAMQIMQTARRLKIFFIVVLL